MCEHPKDSNEYIFKTVGVNGADVILTETAWGHIEKHSEITQDIIREGIEKAHIITPDKDDANRRHYRRMLANHPVSERDNITTIKIIVEATSSDADEVVTSYLITNLKGEVNPGGGVLYDAALQDGV